MCYVLGFPVPSLLSGNTTCFLDAYARHAPAQLRPAVQWSAAHALRTVFPSERQLDAPAQRPRARSPAPNLISGLGTISQPSRGDCNHRGQKQAPTPRDGPVRGSWPPWVHTAVPDPLRGCATAGVRTTAGSSWQDPLISRARPRAPRARSAGSDTARAAQMRLGGGRRGDRRLTAHVMASLRMGQQPTVIGLRRAWPPC